MLSYIHAIRMLLTRRSILCNVSCLLFLSFFISCKKSSLVETPAQATVQVFNALDNGENLFINFSGSRPAIYKTLGQIRNKEFHTNMNRIYLKDFPVQADMYATQDTLPHQPPVLSTTLDLKPGAIYSLFIYGEKTAASYELFSDNIPAINRQDSTSHVRFANFSEAQAISVNIKEKASGSLVQKLPFKSLSEFIELDARKVVTGYIFEIRNQVTDAVLATYTTTNFQPTTSSRSQWLAKSNTLVFTGRPLAASPNNQKITLINHR